MSIVFLHISARYWHWLSFLTGIGSSHVNLPSISGLLHKPPPTSHLQMFGQRLLPSEVVATGGGGQPLMTSGDKSRTASSLSPPSCQNVRTVWRHSLQSSITAIVLKFTAHHHRIFRKLFEIPHFVFLWYSYKVQHHIPKKRSYTINWLVISYSHRIPKFYTDQDISVRQSWRIFIE